MRRNNLSISKVGLFVIIVVILFFVAIKLIRPNSNQDYIDYVSKYSEAIEKYISDKITYNTEKSYTFNEINDILVSSGYINKFDDVNVVVTSDDIVIKKDGNNISFYNFNNTQTLENRFQLKFIKDGNTEFICTKTNCE